MAKKPQKQAAKTEEYSPEITEALNRLHILDDSDKELGHTKYLEQLTLLEEEFEKLGMLQNILIRKGRALVELERYDEAIPALSKTIELANPESKDRFILPCLCDLGHCYYNIKDYEQALSFFEETESLLGILEDEGDTGQLFSYYWERGRTQQALKQYKEAARWLREAIKIVPKVNVPAQQVTILHFDLACVFAEDSNFRAALSELREIDERAIEPDWINVYLLRKCHVLFQQELYTELVQVSEEFIRLNRENSLSEAWYYFACGNNMLGNEAEAQRGIKNSLKFPDSGGKIHELSREYLAKCKDKW